MNALIEQAAKTSGPLARYRERLANGDLTTDPVQALAAERLQNLWMKLRGYDPAPQPSLRRFARLISRRHVHGASEGRLNGLYLAGDVGRGKSMLMDLFFETAPVARRRRLHFNEFMQDVHQRLYIWRVAQPGGADPIPPLADSIAATAALLCFDELQVNDIADAILLGRLFEALFARGVVVVATSNTKPDDLFAGRPGRDAFLPFIQILNRHLDLLILEGDQDWRRHNLRSERVWIVPTGARAEQELDAIFSRLAGNAPSTTQRLVVSGRMLDVPRTAGFVARFDFGALCAVALGPGDYLAIATHFTTMIVDGVPLLGPDNHDEARRFITLIDALYEHRVKLIASAEAQPDSLYTHGEGAGAFRRTASRLQEMQTAEYLALAHLT